MSIKPLWKGKASTEEQPPTTPNNPQQYVAPPAPTDTAMPDSADYLTFYVIDSNGNRIFIAAVPRVFGATFVVYDPKYGRRTVYGVLPTDGTTCTFDTGHAKRTNAPTS